MKIKLSLDEAKKYIRLAMDVPPDTEITIQRPSNKVWKPLQTMINDIQGMRYNANDKIRAIKRFREGVASGLAEAKWAIENWAVTKAWIEKNRKAPTYFGQYPHFDLR